MNYTCTTCPPRQLSITVSIKSPVAQVHDFRLGDHWLESDKERLFWQETNLSAHWIFLIRG